MACMTFKSCDNCYWCRICIHDNRAFKCKINPKKKKDLIIPEYTGGCVSIFADLRR